jgi:molybdate-binding protein/DNA-binding XRE family transcriptional regulator
MNRNMVQANRVQRGWSQAELARRAGISRAAVSAIEVHRVVPSVAVALALARSLAVSVEQLFGLTGRDDSQSVWAAPPTSTPCRYWEASVGRRTVRFPAEPTAAGVVPHDGVFDGAACHPTGEPKPTLVIACCDPAAGLLATEYGRASGFRLLVLPRSSRAALAMLRDGLVHLAGVHFATPARPDANAEAVRDTLGPGYALLRAARWQEGLALSSSLGARSVEAVKRARLRWVGREPGSAARLCQDEVLGGRPVPSRLARDHRGVAEAVRAGWADVGVCVRLASEEAGTRFLAVRQELCDFCFPAGSESDPRVAALLRLIRSSSYRKLLSDLPGYDAADTGELRTVS